MRRLFILSVQNVTKIEVSGTKMGPGCGGQGDPLKVHWLHLVLSVLCLLVIYYNHT